MLEILLVGAIGDWQDRTRLFSLFQSRDIRRTGAQLCGDHMEVLIACLHIHRFRSLMSFCL